MALTLDEANRIIQGAIAKAKALSITINVAACGVGGGTGQEDEDCARAGVEQL